MWQQKKPVSFTEQLSVISILTIFQLAMATEINDTINLWFANPKDIELTLAGIITVLFIILPYLVLLFGTFILPKKQAANDTPNVTLRIAAAALSLLVAVYYSFSRFTLTPITFHFFDYTFVFRDFASTTFLLGLVITAVTYFFTKKLYGKLNLALTLFPLALWSFYVNALFNLLYFLISNKNFAFRQTYAIPLTIMFLLFIFVSLTMYLIIVYKNNPAIPAKQIIKMSMLTSGLYIAIQFVFSILLRL